tara:strand:+ start:4588 stop:5739 length:1152 start_codon:yes stop_codon:yes gene_type:complete
MKDNIIEFIRDHYQTKDFIPLHEPRFDDRESELVLSTIQSTFVSSVGKYVDEFENGLKDYTKSTKAIAVVNGTSALYAALYHCGVGINDIVITQALTFVATANAVSQLNAKCAFVDVSKDTLGMCPYSLAEFLDNNAMLKEDNKCYLKSTGQQIKAVVPMHTFGHPVEIDKIAEVCEKWYLNLVEDAAESLGSCYKGQHTGTFGRYGAISFNGNKIITTGGGGAILCSSEKDGVELKHLTTTAKQPHPYKFFHDKSGFNFRMPNLNAALGCAQLEKLPDFVINKRELAKEYESLFLNSPYLFVKEPKNAHSNYWLNAVVCDDINARNDLLEYTNKNGVMTRPVWELMTELPMYENCITSSLENSHWFAQRLVNIPSSALLDSL